MVQTAEKEHIPIPGQVLNALAELLIKLFVEQNIIFHYQDVLVSLSARMGYNRKMTLETTISTRRLRPSRGDLHLGTIDGGKAFHRPKIEFRESPLHARPLFRSAVKVDTDPVRAEIGKLAARGVHTGV